MCRLLIVLSIEVAMVATLTGHVAGEVMLTEDQSEWVSSVGEFTTIDFTGFPFLTPITDQYADQGVLFSGTTGIWGPTGSFPNDDWGLRGAGGVWAHFDQPKTSLAVDYPGVISIALFNQGELVYESDEFGILPNGNFLGLTSSVAFDEAYLFRPHPFDNIVFIDDLHFGPPIPAPGVLGVFALAAVAGRGRRRGGWKSQLP